MGYRIHTQDSHFKIVEVNNGEVRDIFLSEDETAVRELQRHLNFGGGFDGFTPDFFLISLLDGHESIPA